MIIIYNNKQVSNNNVIRNVTYSAKPLVDYTTRCHQHGKMFGHLVSLIKHHGLFAHTLATFLHPIQRFFKLV
jgi:hypothetical protein